MAALDAVLALTQAHDIAVSVAENLKFDVARMLDELFHVEIAVAEGRGRLRRCGFEQGGQFRLASHNAHAATAAPGGGLDDPRKSDWPRPLERVSLRCDDPIRTRENRNPRLFHGCPRFFLLAHQANELGRWANKLETTGLTHLGKVCVFR